MELVKKGWPKKNPPRGLEYHVKVIGQLFGSDNDDDDLTGPRGSCLVTSLEMATWHLKSKQFMKGTGEFSVFGGISAARRDTPPGAAYPFERLGSITTVSDDNIGEPFELSSPRYYWSQPVLHSIIMGSPWRMMKLVNNSDIDLGIWDKCPAPSCSYCEDKEGSCLRCLLSKPPPTKYDIIDSLQRGERTPILMFVCKRPKIKRTEEGTAKVSFPPRSRNWLEEEESEEKKKHWCGHAVVITGWRRTGKGRRILEFLVNDPSPPPVGVQTGNPRVGLQTSSSGLDKLHRSEEVVCGGKYWVKEEDLFDDDWLPFGLYEVYSNPIMLDKNNGGRDQKLYLSEFTENPKMPLSSSGKVEISNLEIYR